MYKAIIFDVDGTILDTEDAVLDSLQETLLEVGLDYHKTDLRFALGIPGKKTIEQLNISHSKEFLERWQQKEFAFRDRIKIFAGLKEVFEKIPQGGVVTSKDALEMEQGFYPFGIAHYFDAIVCASDTENHKPHPEPLLKSLSMLGRKPNEALYIGDSPYDMAAAHAAGMHFGLALWGAKTTSGFEAADFIFEKPADVLGCI
ncbi:HAD family hydrolase [Listeria sp. PSOL-1]|uniref:HAD family hydrolase n=1 Tax=Listeria sp. PSOL-1 TaxID=1844999 RepID=UPI0013D6FB43|nr:HAD family hydrolase [Listeria sp. PSOL-1]